MKLNLGCHKDIRKGWTNLDCQDMEGVDVVHDLNVYPYPFLNNQVDEVYASHIIEHIDNAKAMLKEIHRICKNKARIKIITPHFSSYEAWADLEHKRALSIICFRDGMIEGFKTIKNEIHLADSKFWFRWFVKRFPYFYEKHLCYFIPAMAIHCELEVEK